MTWVIQTTGLPGFKDFVEQFPKRTRQAARMALNAAAARAVVLGKREIVKQVRLTASYVSGRDTSGKRRLDVTRKASDASLVAIVEGRGRATQLARFAIGPMDNKGRKGVKVRVAQKGGGGRIRQAFWVTLKRGQSGEGNRGLAVRSTEGLNLRRLRATAGKASSGFHVLYGPSVDQVFREVRKEIQPAVLDYAAKEFHRHLARLE